MVLNLQNHGEFTKRAFLNGRIDLSQAEAIIDVINSKSEAEAKASIKQLKGELSERLQDIRKIVMEILVDIEASIDYPEYDLEEVTNERTLYTFRKLEEELEALEKTFINGKIIKEGLNVAIIGRPNAGKSSLLNAILKEERAIVTDIEGTTRDTIEEFIQVEGIPIKIIDTAGIRQTDNKIEKMGISKSIDMAENADFVITIIDASKNIEIEDKQILDIIKNKKGLVLLNKIDKHQIIKKEDINEMIGDKKVIEISALEKTGINEIYEEISNIYSLGKINIDDSLTVTNERHKQIIRNMKENVNKARKAIEIHMPIDVVTINITNILEEIGKITGESVSEDVINEIFKKFCLGK